MFEFILQLCKLHFVYFRCAYLPDSLSLLIILLIIFQDRLFRLRF